jgi:predicted regulator of Ras-like GTPase activity (Roadblock/LC7/MglB family)
VSRGGAAQLAAADVINVPYASIIKLIPQELWGKLAPAGVAGYNFAISRKSVLEQLPSGSVKINFGELRYGAPAGVFINTPAEDGRLVDLPLSEILAQLHPDSFARRPDQSRTDVSPDVPDLFGSKGERLAPLRVMEKKEVSNTTSFARQNPPAVRPAGAPAPAPKAAPSPISAPTIPGNLTPLPFSPSAAIPAPSSAIKLPVPPASAAPKAPAPIQFTLPKASVPAAAQTARPLPKPQPSLPRPAAVAPAAPFQPTPGAPTFLISLDAVADGWPDGVRQELAQLKIPDARIALPSVEICEGLKRGRVQYPWRTLRSWIQPTPIYASPSPHDDQVLELPLRTLTPLFLDFIRENPVNRQAADAENITEFFRKAGQAVVTSPELLQPLFAPMPTAAAPQEVAAAPVVTPAPVVVPTPVVSPAAAPAPVQASTPTAGQAGEPVVENGAICLPFPLIAAGWPEAVLRDIAQFGLAGSRVELPLASVEAGLKVGRLEFAWREICGWLNPPSKPAQVSINAETRVSLPLGLLAPIFLKSRSAAQGRKKTAVAESIPDLFSAAGKPLPPPPTAPQPEAPAPVAAPAAPPAPAAVAPVAPKKVPTNLSELFGEPDKKTWTPNEIVQRTAQLPGVAGSLIALQDGLLVASSMPQQMKTETIAAFVPQIFGRMNQYSKDLQMGDTKAVSFTVDAGTIQVYNAGIIYFASLGKKDALLPLAELQLIAGELSRHTK